MKPETNNNPIDELIQAVDENTIETNSILEHSLQLKSKDSQVLEQQLETGDKTHLEVKKGFESVTKTIEDLSTKKMNVEFGIEINGDDIVYYKGEKGNPGEKPSEEELLSLIKPLIPEPIPGEKGDKGKDPTKDELLALIEPLIPEPIKGDNGNDYILTEKDKAEIASTIEVPVVEKVIERVIEKTEVIKEVTKKTDPKQLKKEIEDLAVDYDSLSNLPDLNKFLRQSSKTTSLIELDDVDYSQATKTNGKYVIPSASAALGDVVGPASAVDSNFASFDTTTGKLIKDSGSKASDFAVALTADQNYVSDAQLVVIGNTSGTNTGDNATNTQYSGLQAQLNLKADKTFAIAMAVAL